MALIDDIRIRLRITTQAFDVVELQPLIDAAKADLARIGITAAETDPLMVQAIAMYCRANFGYTEDSERQLAAYERLRDTLALSRGYGLPAEEAGAT